MAKCPKCGGNLVESQDGLMYVCDECGAKFKKKAGNKTSEPKQEQKKSEKVASSPKGRQPREEEKKHVIEKKATRTPKTMPKIEGIEKEIPKPDATVKAQPAGTNITQGKPVVLIAAAALVVVLLIALGVMLFRKPKNADNIQEQPKEQVQEQVTAEDQSASLELSTEEQAEPVIDAIDPFDSTFFNTSGNSENVSLEWSGASPYYSLEITNNFQSTDYRSHLSYEVSNNGRIATGDDVLITAKLTSEAEDAGFNLTKEYTTIPCKESLRYISFISEIDENTWGLMKEDAIKAVQSAQEIIANGQSDESFVPISINGNSIKPETEDVKYGFYDGANVKKVKFTKAILFSKKNGSETYDNKLYLVFKCNRTGSKRPGNPTLEGAVSFVEVKDSLLLQDNGEIKYDAVAMEAMLSQMFTSQEKFDEVLMTQMKEDYNVTEMALDWVVE